MLYRASVARHGSVVPELTSKELAGVGHRVEYSLKEMVGVSQHHIQLSVQLNPSLDGVRDCHTVSLDAEEGGNYYTTLPAHRIPG